MAITRVIRILILLTIGVGGLAMTGAGGNMLLNEHSDVKHAVTVEGTVKSTDVTKTAGGGTGSLPATVDWSAVIRYTYTYDGQEYTSDSVYPGPEKSFKSEEVASTVATQVSPGQTVTVYVNQRSPSRAFLINETGGNILPFLLLGIGGLIAVPFLLGVGQETIRGVKGS